jgi:hypothetical protein
VGVREGERSEGHLVRRRGPVSREAIGEAQDMLPLFDITPNESPDMDECDEGYCAT